MTRPGASLTCEGPIATITLDRPGCFNAIDAATAVTLANLACALARSETVRVVVIRGAGRAFCAGGDIAVFAAHLDDPGPMVREILDPLHAFLVGIRSLPAVVVTSVHGAAAGGGFSLALAGDLCIAADTARFTPAYARLGVSPDGGGSVRLVEAVGARRALQILLMEDGFDAHRAAAWGLVNAVVPEADLADATRRLAERLAAFNPAAVAATKRLIHASARTPMADQLEAEMSELIGCMETEPFREAVRRFVGRGDG